MSPMAPYCIQSENYCCQKNNSMEKMDETSQRKGGSINEEAGNENLEPWKERWEARRIKFHMDTVNPALSSHLDVWLRGKNERVFFPLCGKTVDMAYLVQKYPSIEVVGNDGIQMAFEEFFQEHPDLNIRPSESIEYENFQVYKGNRITLLRGDYFKLERIAAKQPKATAVFDRGSLVAIDPSLRHRYLEIMRALVAPQARILLVTLERRGSDPEAVARGPPFSMTESYVRDLFDAFDNWVDSVTLLESQDTFLSHPEDKQRFDGLDSLWEHVFLIQLR